MHIPTKGFEDKTLFWILEAKSEKASEICRKMDYNVQNVNVISDEELCELWSHVKLILIDIQNKHIKQPIRNCSNVKEYKMSINIIITTIKLALATISTRQFVPQKLLETAIVIHCTILPEVYDRQVKENASLFLEKWWKLDLMWKERIIANAIKHLIRRAKISLQHVKRLYAIRLGLHVLKCTEDIQNLLRLVRETTIISIKEGRGLVAYLFTFGGQWTMGIHNNVKVALESAGPKKIRAYAELYITALINANDQKREFIAQNCLQDIIFHCLRGRRESEANSLHANLLNFLDFFHKESNVSVKKIIYRVYQALLWKHLKAPGSVVRCNAAEVLFHAYPIQPTQAKLEDSNSQLIQQYKAMTELLKDSNYEICLLSVKSISILLKDHWSDVPDSVVNEWLDIFLNYTMNSNFPEIRTSIFLGLKLILSNPDSTHVVKKILPKFANSLYDCDVGVKEAFVELLIYVRDHVDLEIEDVIPISHIFELPEMKDNRTSSELIVKLLWPTMYSNRDATKVIRRINSMPFANINSVRTFFMNSKSTIDHSTALQLIITILQEIKERAALPPTENSINGYDANKNYSNSVNMDEISPAISTKLEDKTDLNVTNAQTLFDVAAILWTINRDKFSEEELENLRTIIDTLPHLYDCFKNTPASESIIFLFSLLPESSIPAAAKFSNTCIARLRDPNVSDDTIYSIIHLLVKWDKVDEVLTLITRLLDNPTNVTSGSKSPKRMRLIIPRIKNETLELGWRVLKHLLHDDFKSVVMQKYHQDLVELWDRLHFVKELIEIELDDSSDDAIREDVLEHLFHDYVSLIPSLDRIDIFDASEHFIEVLSWAYRTVPPHLPKMEDTKSQRFSINLLKTIFQVSNKVLPEFPATPKLYCDLVLLYTKCLFASSGIVFANEASIALMILINFNAFAFKDDECHILSVVGPSLLAAIMVTLTKYSTDDVIKHADDLKWLPTLLFRLFLRIKSSLNHSALNIAYMTIAFNTAVVCVSKELTEALREEREEQIDVLNVELPYMTQTILRVVLRGEKFPRLCVEVLKKFVPNYKPIDLLSALLIIYKTFGSKTKVSAKSVEEIISKAKSRETREMSVSHSSFIDDSTKLVINTILNQL